LNHVQELFSGAKYKMKSENETYSLIITTPKLDDMGRYTCEINGIKTEAFLTVEGNVL